MRPLTTFNYIVLKRLLPTISTCIVVSPLTPFIYIAFKRVLVALTQIYTKDPPFPHPLSKGFRTLEERLSMEKRTDGLDHCLGSGGGMQIFVKTLTDKTITLEVRRTHQETEASREERRQAEKAEELSQQQAQIDLDEYEQAVRASAVRDKEHEVDVQRQRKKDEQEWRDARMKEPHKYSKYFNEQEWRDARMKEPRNYSNYFDVYQSEEPNYYKVLQND